MSLLGWVSGIDFRLLRTSLVLLELLTLNTFYVTLLINLPKYIMEKIIETEITLPGFAIQRANR